MDSTLQTVLVVVVAVGATAWIVVVAATAVLGHARARAATIAAAVVALRARGWRAGRRVVAVPGRAACRSVAGGWVAGSTCDSVTSDWWIGTGIGAWIVAFLGSTLLRGTAAGAGGPARRRRGADDEDVQWRIRQVDLTSRGELLLLVGSR